MATPQVDSATNRATRFARVFVTVAFAIAGAIAMVRGTLSAPAAGVLVSLVGALWSDKPLAAFLRRANDDPQPD